MPQNITDANTWTTPIISPADGDTEAAASVLVGLQGLANRANYIVQMLGGTTGNSRNAVNGFAGLDAGAKVPVAQLPTNVASGVAGLNGAAQVPIAQLPIGAVNGVCGLDGSGFIPSAYIPFGAANKVPQLDASSRLPAATVRNGIIAMSAAVFGTVATVYSSTTSATFVDVGTAAITLAGSVANDIVRFSASIPYSTGASGGTIALTILDGASTVNYQQIPTSANASGIAAFNGQYTVINGGTITVKLRQLNLGAAASNAVGQMAIDAMLLRP